MQFLASCLPILLDRDTHCRDERTLASLEDVKAVESSVGSIPIQCIVFEIARKIRKVFEVVSRDSSC